VVCLVPVFPPGTRAKALLGRPIIPKLIGRLFWRHVQESVFADHQGGISCGRVIHGTSCASIDSLRCSGRNR